MKSFEWFLGMSVFLALSPSLVSYSSPGTTATPTPTPTATSSLPVRNTTQGNSYATIQGP